MTSPRPLDPTAEPADRVFEHLRRPRSGAMIAYVVATAAGGVGALVIAAVLLLSGSASAVDVLLWAAMAVLLLGAAAHRWWLGGRNEERSRRIAAAIRPEQVAAAIRGSSGEIDAVRRLRVSHPGLGLRHAYDLYQHYAREHR
ncbi:hypothetical protein [Dietzia cinnamea]|uniref:hypothetical protein n=2 Tax=Dietzia TaxID=37914 RepID=UPI0021A6B619|nr:hypothetical protein [Dietzia cinnamea]MCT1639634.1 hypothetical protein [Dietzia cinnamea]MCT1711966.1 hypothetical protein [Dietzia cinnamea]